MKYYLALCLVLFAAMMYAASAQANDSSVAAVKCDEATFVHAHYAPGDVVNETVYRDGGVLYDANRVIGFQGENELSGTETFKVPLTVLPGFHFFIVRVVFDGVVKVLTPPTEIDCGAAQVDTPPSTVVVTLPGTPDNPQPDHPVDSPAKHKTKSHKKFHYVCPPAKAGLRYHILANSKHGCKIPKRFRHGRPPLVTG